MNKKIIAERLVRLRGNKTQTEIARAIGVCQSTYAMYETGQRIPSDERKKKIAEYYKKSVQSIFFKD
ncbi:MAG: helix-turn-helix domain-containing protein [Clostridium sp.]|nr:helix-turn-helix domain-containing protein [Clostridium sp.]MCM1459706.1 helix-turn-helix domain-containing protein [Bacteroides sp.]